MKRIITLVFFICIAVVANAQTDSLCLCKLNLASPDIKSKLKLVKTKPIAKAFKIKEGEKGKSVDASLYKLTYKYSNNGVKATFVTKKLTSAIDENQYAEFITVKARNTTIDLFGCTFEVPKKGKYINCTR